MTEKLVGIGLTLRLLSTLRTSYMSAATAIRAATATHLTRVRLFRVFQFTDERGKMEKIYYEDLIPDAEEAYKRTKEVIAEISLKICYLK